MHSRALVALIALSAVCPGLGEAGASGADSAKGAHIAAHQSSAPTKGRTDASLPKGMIPPMPGSVRSRSGSTATHSGAAAAPRGRTPPSGGHLTPTAAGAGAAARSSAAVGLPGNDPGRHHPIAAALGGPARYDAKKGAVIGGAAPAPPAILPKLRAGTAR